MSKDFWEDDAKAAGPQGGFWDDDAASLQTMKPRIPEGESALRGAAQGLTFGLADEGTGAVEAAKDTLFGDAKLRDYIDRYKQHRDESRANYAKAQKENPKSYLAGEVGGSVASSFIPGLGWSNAAKGANLTARLGRAALAGGTYGLGNSEVDLTKGTDLTPEDVKNVVSDVGTGAAFGAAGQGAGEALGKVGSKFASGLSNLADVATIKGAGGMTADFRSLRRQGKTKELADFLRRKGVVSFGSNVDDAVERSKALQSAAKEDVANKLMQLDQNVAESGKMQPVAMEMSARPSQMSVNAGDGAFDVLEHTGASTRLPTSQQGFIPSQAAERIKSDVVNPMMEGPYATKQVAGQVQKEIDDLAARGDAPMSFVDTNKLKNKYYDLIGDYGKEKSPYIESLKKFAGSLNKEMESKADEVAQAAGDPSLYKGWKQSKSDLGNSITAHDMASNRADQLSQNRAFSLTDYLAGGIAGAGGLSADDPEKALYALPAMLVNKQLRTRGPAALGITANKAAQALKTKYAAILQKAAAQGPKALSAAHFLLKQKDPNYQEILKEE